VTTTRQFALKKSRALLGDLRTHMARAIATGEEEAVHQTRLAIRRWFAAEAALRDFFDVHEEAKVHRTLKKIMRATSSVRDCDVTGKLLQKLEADADLLKRLSQRRAKLARRLTKVLREAAVGGIQTHLGRAVKIRAGAGSKPVTETARGVLGEAIEKLRERGAAVVRPGTAAKTLHHFRIRAKKLRYTLELFSGELFSGELFSGAGEGYALQAQNGQASVCFEAWIEPVRQVQSLLGDVHGCEAAREMIADWPGRREVNARLKKRREEKLRQFRRLWSERFATASLPPPALPKPR
jgi:CHAD domain-containing protein